MNDAAWSRAALALQLLALDPFGLGGAVIRMRSGPQRDAIVHAMRGLFPTTKLPVSIGDDQLFGGLDLSATLATGRLTQQKGLLETPRVFLMPMAERCEPRLAARLAGQIDTGDTCCVICLDEGENDDEGLPFALADRFAFHIAPEGRLPSDWTVTVPSRTSSHATASDAQIETLVLLAVRLGIDSMRAPILALRAACAHARLQGRTTVTEDDLEAGAALVYPHRATQRPDVPNDDSEAPQPDTPDAADQGEQDIALPDGDMLVAAIAALLPPGLIKGLSSSAKSASGSGAGSKRVAKRRGRPLPPRPGRLDGRGRIDIVATLRTAAPWQKLRAGPLADRIIVHPSDIRMKRFEERSERLLIFTVDASGSAAVARLGEAKGAVELLLADAYASRDHVALIAFRGATAEMLLPPTRSLVQTKRRLAALPGGGGTPLAAGLQEAGRLALHARGRGMSPTVVLLTDGRANVALNGDTNRKTAQDDAERLAIFLKADGTTSLVIDTGNRPSNTLQNLSVSLGSPYVALPRADAHRLQSAVATALNT